MNLAFERFDRRLAEECSAIRVEMAESQARLRVDVSKELHEGLAGVRAEMAGLRVEVYSIKSELFKWSFLFWIGQVAVMVGLLSFMR